MLFSQSCTSINISAFGIHLFKIIHLFPLPYIDLKIYNSLIFLNNAKMLQMMPDLHNIFTIYFLP